tara:strand:- start:540 stop:932 length:393 start_codon:yes stop_codon:yes gene_type:complete
MKQKFKIIAFFLLLSELSYSQSVLVDNNGDTLVAITIQQMDDIYVELIQKDSLVAQSEISRSKELKLYELITIAENNLESCEKVLKVVGDSNMHLLSEDKKKSVKLKRTRKIALYAILFAVLEGLVIAVL